MIHDVGGEKGLTDGHLQVKERDDEMKSQEQRTKRETEGKQEERRKKNRSRTDHWVCDGRDNSRP